MGSLGGEVARKQAMWMYPKMMGANPSERWGHSACYFNGLLYIFGGCRGGVHFSDVLVCNLGTTTWSILKTSGPGPGPRDSHTAVLVGHKMFVFGGTNGCKKVNDLHVLDLVSREWARPECRGNPPCPRESHTANVFGDEKLVIFGGSGEGEANYLNDLHVLDLKSMEWSSPEVRGIPPARRDSHSSVGVGNRLFVYGGDSGDRYQGDVSVLDTSRMVWSRVDARGASPGARAGHAAVSVGTKVYVLGGVGDKQYYNDIWVLDVLIPSWAQLDVHSRKSQGRFSHTATVTNLGIAVFGGCGEDERPLNELLVLQLDSLARGRVLGNAYKGETTKMLLSKAEINLPKTILVPDNEDLPSQEVEELDFVTKPSFCFSSDMLHPKRRRTSNSKKPEPEEHFASHSQQSSPSSQPDHEPIPLKENISTCYTSSRVNHLFRQKNSFPSRYQLNNIPEHPNQLKKENTSMICNDQSLEAGKFINLIGAEVRGQVDGAFDSGYLMTANVNGKVFRGVLFAPGPDVCASRGPTIVGQQFPLSLGNQIGVGHGKSGQNHPNNAGYLRHIQESRKEAKSRRSSPVDKRAPRDSSRVNTELEGVVLTLASPASTN